MKPLVIFQSAFCVPGSISSEVRTICSKRQRQLDDAHIRTMMHSVDLDLQCVS